MGQDRPLRILQVCFGKEGGAERFFVNLAQAFDRRGGVEQRFMIRPDRTWRRHIVSLGPTIENNYRYLSLSRWWLRAEYRRIIRNWQPDVVFSWAPRAGRLQQPRPMGPLKLVRLGDYPLHLKHFRNCDLIVSNTPAITQHVQELGWTKPAVTITNFARPVTAEPVDRSTHDTPDDAFVVATAGRFVNRKGFDVAIRAVARTEGAWLWIMGDGPEDENLRALAAESGIMDRTRFLGWIDEPVHHFASADAVIFPSRHEPLGNVILDAWQANKPVVATRSEGPGWFLRDGVDGILTEIDDIAALSDGLAALQSDPLLRERYAEAGRTRLRTFFGEDAIVDSYLELFRNGPEAIG